MTLRLLPLAASIGIALSACGGAPPTQSEDAIAPVQAPGQAFWSAIQPHCGQAYEGQLVSGREGDDGFRDQTVIVHIKHCEDSRLLIPLHVGDDHSRTWVLERHAWGVSLKHEHRDPDGSPQTVSRYGGLARPPADGYTLRFPVDDETLAMLPNSVGGFWTLSTEDDTLHYQVEREGREGVFHLTFDLSESVEPPEAPWGWDAIR
ncbi:hypothetical protein J2T60_000486 [Natronospira proteinivora]|uniref:Secreted protein n=1 Tax=Natronospira proteinivora TaxID=1807133 RepID=A0ABT1G5F0_9GAMM|nr:hypothetical protein [Natronospira proteinivora]MCP1726521.1 hypothetical protein [Natronospira proteinivora]